MCIRVDIMTSDMFEISENKLAKYKYFIRKYFYIYIYFIFFIFFFAEKNLVVK
jgi:hypothetical protein